LKKCIENGEKEPDHSHPIGMTVTLLDLSASDLRVRFKIYRLFGHDRENKSKRSTDYSDYADFFLRVTFD
jgi:hypothetical protein